ncbi:MAG TPA: hypothetical protein VGJ86_03595 [Acidimicrobiales bacterium]|jgi:ABC-2 type transport system permease protein
MSLAPTLGGAVYDRGYRPYEGPRGGRNYARWALWRLSVRRALGIRRSWRQKVLPWTLLGLATLPACVDIGIRYATRNTPPYRLDADIEDFLFTFKDYVGVSTLLLLFVAVSAPDIICPDRHDRVLPLLFSRQLTGVDYVVAKVSAMFAIIFGFAFIPQVVLFVGQMFVNKNGSIDYFQDHLDVLWKVPISIAILALYYALVSVALASLTDRRMVAGIAFIGLMMITHAVGQFFIESARPDGTIMSLVQLWTVPLVLRDIVFLGHVEPLGRLQGVEGAGFAAVFVYLAVLTASAAVLLWRYREVDL